MTAEPTVTVKGVEFPAKKLRETIEMARERSDGNEKVIKDTVVWNDDVWVAGDSDADTYALVGYEHASGNIDAVRTYTTTIDQKIDQAVDQDFAKYVESVMDAGTYTFDDDENVYRADLAVAEHDDGNGYVKEVDMDALIEDDGIDVHSIDNGWLQLTDVREE